MSAKFWPATEDDMRRCFADPRHVDTMFHRVDAQEDGYALLHGARALVPFLDGLVALRTGVSRIERAADPTFWITPRRIQALLEGDTDDPHRALLALKTECVNGVQIADIVRAAARSGRGLLVCVFEDW